MAQEPKLPKERLPDHRKFYCLCDCDDCDIGACEKCTSPQCHGAKWSDLPGYEEYYK